MLSPVALAAAGEINERWRQCIDGSHVDLGADCPSNEEVAAIIERNFNPGGVDVTKQGE